VSDSDVAALVSFQLHLWTHIPEAELRTLTPKQAANCLATLRDAQEGWLTDEEAVQRLDENGIFDLPSQVEERGRYFYELHAAECRAFADHYNADCLRQGKPEDMVRLVEDGGYPPARSN
jgi:hypothetical protein